MRVAETRLRGCVRRKACRHGQRSAWPACDAGYCTNGGTGRASPRHSHGTASQGFRTWQEANIQHFEARWPVGTAQRLAFDLCLYTGQRRSDVVRMGPQHVRDGVLSIRQQKTGTEVVIPVHGNLLASLGTVQTGEMVFLRTSQGRAFTANGFGNFFRDAVESAGLRGLSAHGLRKAACRRLAEAGCSAHEIMSISGHVSLREVQRYTMAVNREQMARSAFQKLGTSQNRDSQT